MAYRVAVVQNESELMRYSYADARHLVSKTDYEWSWFTSENIDSLGTALNGFDALIIATNCCNNPRLLAWLERNQARIYSFLKDRNRGLLVLFQMALADMRGSARPYPFLTNAYRVRGAYRFASGEQAADGSLAISTGSERHPVLRFPNRIDVGTVEERSRTNNNAPGVYWGYFQEYAENAYTVLVEDAGAPGPRPLLLATRDAVGPRIVVSSLVLDWQRHDDLWENTVRYVVEGLNEVAIIRRRGTSSFNMDLLEHSLRERRVPFAVYSANDLLEWKDDDRLFPSVVLDPTWSREEVAALFRDAGTAHNVYFFDALTPALQATSVVPQKSEYQSIVEAAAAWLVSLWDGEQWEKSFWSSYDIIDLLLTAGLPVEPYRAGLLADIKVRLQPNGSYDDVFGATCAVLQMFTWLGYRGDEFDRALAWIRQELDVQNLYNSATAVEVLGRVAPEALSESFLRRVIDQISQTAPHWADGLETLRYLKTLLAAGEHEVARAQIHRLLPAASGRQEWLNVFGAAETVGILLQLHESSQGTADDLEMILFRGIGYLLDQYDRDSATWRGSIVATAKAAKAVAQFDTKASPAIVDAIRSITARRVQTSSARAMELLLTRNRALTEELAEARSGREATRSALGAFETGARRLQNWILVGIASVYVLLVLAVVLTLNAFSALDNAVKWVADWQEASVPLALCVVMLPLLLITIALSQFGREPAWLRFVREHLRFLAPVVGAGKREGGRNDASARQ